MNRVEIGQIEVEWVILDQSGLHLIILGLTGKNWIKLGDLAIWAILVQFRKKVKH